MTSDTGNIIQKISEMYLKVKEFTTEETKSKVNG